MTDVKHESLAEALAAFQAEVPVFAKDKTATVRMKSGGTYSYKYADLGDILPIVNPLLAKHGLSWSSKPVQTDAGIALQFTLRHVGGDSDEGIVPLGLGQNYNPQDLGSSLTYLRRYAMTAQLNITTDEDVDSRVTVQEPSAPPSPALASPEQRSQIFALATEKGMSSSLLAKVILLATGNEVREWESDQAARAWLVRALEKLPADSVPKVLAAIEAPE